MAWTTHEISMALYISTWSLGAEVAVRDHIGWGTGWGCATAWFAVCVVPRCCSMSMSQPCRCVVLGNAYLAPALARTMPDSPETRTHASACTSCTPLKVGRGPAPCRGARYGRICLCLGSRCAEARAAATVRSHRCSCCRRCPESRIPSAAPPCPSADPSPERWHHARRVVCMPCLRHMRHLRPCPSMR